MYPEDRVLVGVITRKGDFTIVRDERWYRIPQEQMPQGINAEYIAFFLSGTVFKEQSGGIHYYAPVKGLELAYRRDLIPDKPNHKNADKVYYKIALGDLQIKNPPVQNTSKRPIAFIRTTWDRFITATTIRDLYSDADYFVDRIYHALRNTGIAVQRLWEADKKEFVIAPGLHILCENGSIDASANPGQGAIYMDLSQSEDTILAAIRAEIDKQGGPVYINIPTDNI